MTQSCLLPEFDGPEIAEIAHRLFALEGHLKQLDGERDLNYLITDKRGKFVLKIANAKESAQMFECQHQVFQQLATARVFPRVATALKSVNGNFIETVSSHQRSKHVCRVLPYIEGQLLSQVDSVAVEILEDLGRSLALLDRSLQSFSHPALERPILWNICDALETLASFRPLLADDQRRELIEYFEANFRRRVSPLQGELRHSVIHNDANDNNVLVDTESQRVVSIIDFGDMVNSWLAAEAAIAAAYAMLGHSNPLAIACAILRGYHRTLAFDEVEISLMFDLICMRLCISVCVCAYQRSLEPDNEYLSVSEKPALALLHELRQIAYQDAHNQMRLACGMVVLDE